ncbi:uncharacterized protein LOC109599583 isoform X2 [Aethina tumida]|uniref:uncharacterized protein LOC109599583 isoform X2 n=1 Tax=Aethina tumida TaxID=116153 RepID=UPI0021494376|nr:uncharacterized protein LOC109599583 isoform X2 [Aethina tumida]
MAENNNLSEAMDNIFDEAYVEWGEVHRPGIAENIFVLMMFFTGIIGFASTLFLAITIRRFKRLRTRINTYIFNIAVLTVVYYLSNPILDILFVFTKYEYVWCWSYHLESAAIFMVFVMSFCMLLDWTLMAFKTNFMVRTGSVHKYFIGFLYVLGVIIWLLHGLDCQFSFFVTDVLLYNIGYIAICVSVAILDIIIAKSKVPYESTKTIYAVTMANLFVYAWLPSYLLYSLINENLNYTDHSILVQILFVVTRLCTAFGHLSGIIACYLLGRRNKHFKMAFDRTFKKSVKNYDTDDLDVASDDEKEEDGLTISRGAPQIFVN